MKELIHGNDSFRSRQYINKIYISRDNYKIIDCSEKSPDLVIQLIQNIDLFNPTSLFIIKNLSSYKNAIDIIQEIFKTNDEKIDYIFHESTKIPKSTKYYKFFNQKSEIIEFELLKKIDFKKYLKQVLDDNEIKIETDAYNLFIELLDNNVELLHNEINKLKLIDSNIITVSHIRENIVNNKEIKIWELIDNINLLDKDKALNTFKEIMDSGEDINYIISMLNRNIRLITEYTYLSKIKKLDKKEIPQILGIMPFALTTVSYYGNRISIDKCQEIYKTLCSFDYEVKHSNTNIESLAYLYIMNVIDNVI